MKCKLVEISHQQHLLVYWLILSQVFCKGLSLSLLVESPEYYLPLVSWGWATESGANANGDFVLEWSSMKTAGRSFFMSRHSWKNATLGILGRTPWEIHLVLVPFSWMIIFFFSSIVNGLLRPTVFCGDTSLATGSFFLFLEYNHL